jgi:hypothetical protein
MKLCVDTEQNCGQKLVKWSFVETETRSVAESWLHETVCRQRPEMWPKDGYIKLCVDRDKNCGRKLAT